MSFVDETELPADIKALSTLSTCRPLHCKSTTETLGGFLIGADGQICTIMSVSQGKQDRYSQVTLALNLVCLYLGKNKVSPDPLDCAPASYHCLATAKCVESSDEPHPIRFCPKNFFSQCADQASMPLILHPHQVGRSAWRLLVKAHFSRTFNVQRRSKDQKMQSNARGLTSKYTQYESSARSKGLTTNPR
ncbi:hypothetical protein BDN67DRAFT_347683 [Paxillus ammoniavirescens]|nr:hypothetical protein BDN67DRAFT_347683 [Paxillus ammoniavirescens]